jgi:hypothetical protein
MPRPSGHLIVIFQVEECKRCKEGRFDTSSPDDDELRSEIQAPVVICALGIFVTEIGARHTAVCTGDNMCDQ